MLPFLPEPEDVRGRFRRVYDAGQVDGGVLIDEDVAAAVDLGVRLWGRRETIKIGGKMKRSPSTCKKKTRGVCQQVCLFVLQVLLQGDTRKAFFGGFLDLQNSCVCAPQSRRNAGASLLNTQEGFLLQQDQLWFSEF